MFDAKNIVYLQKLEELNMLNAVSTADKFKIVGSEDSDTSYYINFTSGFKNHAISIPPVTPTDLNPKETFDRDGPTDAVSIINKYYLALLFNAGGKVILDLLNNDGDLARRIHSVGIDKIYIMNSFSMIKGSLYYVNKASTRNYLEFALHTKSTRFDLPYFDVPEVFCSLQIDGTNAKRHVQSAPIRLKDVTSSFFKDELKKAFAQVDKT